MTRIAIAIVLQCCLVLGAGVLVFPIFVTVLDDSVLHYHLHCRHHLEGKLPSPSGRYEVVLTSYQCPTLFYPSYTKVLRVRVSDSSLPDFLNGSDIYSFNGYTSQARPTDVVQWLSDMEIQVRLQRNGPAEKVSQTVARGYDFTWIVILRCSSHLSWSLASRSSLAL